MSNDEISIDNIAHSSFLIPHSSLLIVLGGVYRSRTGDLCIANAALWPTELIPQENHLAGCKDITIYHLRFTIDEL